MLSRSCWLKFALVLSASTVAAPTLRQSAERAHVLIGAAVRPQQLSEPVYTETLAREFNLVEPEDAMKWWRIHRTQDTFDFQEADTIVRFAQAHNMKVRGHCLVWSRDNPGWLAHGTFTSAQLSNLLHEHITKVMQHYAGQVFAWDVVNEALDENGRLHDSIWYNQPGIGLKEKGTAYVEQVFRWAHKADPHALLFYNEAEGEGLNRKSDAVYAMVKDFLSRGVPIDGVGLQLHISQLGFDSSALAANVARLTSLGIQVHITELDISLPIDSHGQATEENLKQQAEVYKSVVHACLQNPGCTAIQTWGFTDKYSWIGSHSHGTRGAALLFGRDYQPKPAYRAVSSELATGRPKPQDSPPVPK